MDGMLVHRKVTTSIKFAGTHLYTWLRRGTVRVKCLAQEHNTMSPARTRTRTARSGDERTNHEATAPLLVGATPFFSFVITDSSVVIFADYVCVLDLGMFELSLFTSDGSEQVRTPKQESIDVFHVNEFFH